MPFLVPEQPELQEVFSLSTPQHMLHKLFWEVALFKRAIDGTERSKLRNSAFAAFNCAVTAAHCADWAWSAAGPETRAKLGRRFGFGVKGKERVDEKAFFDALEVANRDFYICRRLANGAKHMRRGAQPHAVHAMLKGRVGTVRGEDHYLVDFIIVDGATEVLVGDMFNRMCDFWERLCGELGFIEGKYVDSNWS